MRFRADRDFRRGLCPKSLPRPAGSSSASVARMVLRDGAAFRIRGVLRVGGLRWMAAAQHAGSNPLFQVFHVERNLVFHFGPFFCLLVSFCSWSSDLRYGMYWS